MTLPTRDTRVTYPDGAVEARARVLHVAPAGEGRVAVVTDVTSFHPVDAAWPDQPADTGVIRSGGTALPVLDAVVAASDGTELFLGIDIPVRKGTEGWAFVVAHLLDEGAAIAEGDEVGIEADAMVRRSLSIGHTACHVASLALNSALAPRWSKPARTDALGNPDFDGIAIDTSRIQPNGSVDRYRVNKSVRRAGFDASGLDAALDELAASVEATLAEWAESGAAVRVERDASGDGLTDRRSWVCELPGGTARIPCGGTHAGSLAELGELQVSFELSDDRGTPVLEMRTSATADR
ncbi:metal-dependent hydrolase [Agromyces sp. ISL-38]|uniref:metal-dependent hydrolase n=1 Tax=Agromyces sp. ISL-38 TaxID=2819107 RepID=UPI001BEB8334|nr:metal-dependent hydrolase [Agromyces sp. ISL-38]MBT2498055.1 metal-dependent hydrolase [Agromyces sp. ISL-38]MBT2519381.1 metal-dependent hydrolase [Streptomyces sp. ISL-90]